MFYLNYFSFKGPLDNFVTMFLSKKRLRILSASTVNRVNFEKILLLLSSRKMLVQIY